MSTAMPPRASGIRADASSSAGAAADGSGGATGGAVDSGTLVAVGTVAGTSPGSTSSPIPSTSSGRAKPQSSRSLAWSAARSGLFSVFMTLTTSTRPPRSAAPTNVCRAASVNPVFPPIVPG
jgi:hypothetical protein